MTTFEEYLKRKHFEDEPMTLDDDLESAYERWLEWQGIDLIIEYAEAWHKELWKCRRIKHECCDGECNHDDCCGKVAENCPNHYQIIK